MADINLENGPRTGKLDGIQEESDLKELIGSEIPEPSEYSYDASEYINQLEDILLDDAEPDRLYREIQNDAWYICPECKEEIEDALSLGAMRSEINDNPGYAMRSYVNEEETEYLDDDRVKKTGHFLVWCKKHGIEGEERNEFFMYSESWYAEPQE